MNKQLREGSTEFIQIDFVPSCPEMEIHISLPLELCEDGVKGALFSRGFVSNAKSVVLEFRTKVQERVEMHIRKAKYHADYKLHLMTEVISKIKRGEVVPTSFRESIDVADKAEYEHSSAALRVGMALVRDSKYLDMLANGDYKKTENRVFDYRVHRLR